MNFNFIEISLPILITPKPLELLKLLDQQSDAPYISRFSLLHNFLDLDYLQLRTLDEIIDDIENDQIDNIKMIEWLYCIYYKSEWDSLHPDRSLSTSQKIWLLSKQIKQLKQFLFWDLALFCGCNERDKLANSLVDSFKFFIAESIEDRKIVSIIKILTNVSPEINIAAMCQQYLLTPHKLFKRSNLPTLRLESLVLAYNVIVDLFVKINRPNDKQVKWLLDCLEEMTVEQEIKAVDKLLTTVGAEIGISHPNLVNWITIKYRIGTENYRWNYLSIKAREALRKWQGAVNYGDFQKLVDIILNRSQIYLEPYERNQLEKRQVFWSHYTDKFNRIRILIPQSSQASVRAILSTQDICVLKEDGSETEICIFDFEEWFLVEFFRGAGSDIQIFTKSSEFEKILFESNDLSASSIRSLGEDIHDHVYCWQNSCVRWLMEKGIHPNEGTKEFKGLPFKGSHYDPNIGLPPLQQEASLHREKALTKWRRQKY